MQSRNKKQCEKCTKEISNSNFNKHFSSCSGIKEELTRTYDDEGSLICSFCGKKSKNDNAWRNHHRTCSSNTERNYKNGMTGKSGGNQFTKAKRLGLEIPEISFKTRQKISMSSKGRKMSDAGRMKISKAMKLAHSELRAGRLNPIGKYKVSNRPCRIYVIRAAMFGKEFIKIGITEKTVEERFNGVFDDIEVLREIPLDNGFFIATMEKYLLQYFAKIGMRLETEKFSGHTECFKMDILGEIDNKITEFLFFNQDVAGSSPAARANSI